ncbi:hypothetical protein [Candidatus Binatus sp.]|jgi:hypothetical protein|uniref:hypothetical protein n=1 Tax=Candidatus Binatus sp. TaxID=2811406 RepID=UPI003BD99464
MDKLPRTQTISVRLDPKLRYLSEIAARRQRRTISSFVEWSIEYSLNHFFLTDSDGNTNSVGDLAGRLWDISPADRFVKLALHYPDLLTHDEEMLWRLIQENGFLWRGSFVENKFTWKVKEGGINLDRLRQYWETFNKVAHGEAPESELPTWAKTKYVPHEAPDWTNEPPDPEDDLDDIPD